MKIYDGTPFLYERGFHIGESLEYKALSADRPDCFVDQDCRSKSINMGLPHYHRFYEILLLLSPRCNHYVEGRRYQMKQGDMILLKPGILHQSEYVDDNPNDRILIQFSLPAGAHFPEGRNWVLEPFNSPVPVFRFEPEILNRLAGELNAMTEDSQRYEGYPGRDLMVHARLTTFLCELEYYSGKNIFFQRPDTGVRGKIYSIVNYIHQHYNEPLSLSILADRFYINPYYLSHCFRDQVGFTPGEYIRVTRIRNAQYLLDFSNRKVTEIAQMSGFSSFSQFNRSFHKLNGMSPSEYRRRQTMKNTEVVVESGNIQQ